MAYLDDMKRLLQLDSAVYAEFGAGNRALHYTVVNVALLGLIYGAATLYFSRQVLAQSGVFDGHYNALVVVMVGLSVAFLMHGATGLFIWVFCRALGGCPHFMPPYLNLGAAAIAFWPLAPLVARLQAAPANAVLWTACLAAAAYAAAAAYIAVQAAAGLSRGRMVLCAAATLFYAACFLYLWT